jgi:hypothetical protein
MNDDTEVTDVNTTSFVIVNSDGVEIGNGTTTDPAGQDEIQEDRGNLYIGTDSSGRDYYSPMT